MPHALDVVELIHVAAGVLVIGVVLTAWRCAGSPTLLRHCPWRTNRLTWTAVLLCAVIYFSFAVLTRQLIGYFGVAAEESHEPSATVLALVNSVAQTAGLAACLFVGAVSFRRGLAGLGLTLARWQRSIKWAVLGLLAFEPVVQALFLLSLWVISLVRPDYSPPEHPVIDFLRRPETTTSQALLLCFGAAVLAPVAEEVFFRGIVQTILRRTLRNRYYAVTAAAVVFGISHLQQPQVVLPLIAFGILLGICYERTGSLLGPMLLHALFNAKSLLWELLY